MKQSAVRLVEDFFAKFPSKKYAKGKVLVRGGEEPSGVWYLKSGWVRQYAISKDGEELMVHLFKPGSFFPLIWAMNKMANRFYFEALTPVEVVRAPKRKVVEWLKTETGVMVDLSSRLLHGLNGLVTRLEQLVFASAKARVAGTLVWLKKHLGGSYVFSHREIAAFAGLTRETTSLEMGKLKREGLISYRGRRLVIKNSHKLKNVR